MAEPGGDTDTDTEATIDFDAAPALAGTLPFPGFLVHLYTNNVVVLYDEKAQTAVKLSLSRLTLITTLANRHLREIREALVAKIEAAQAERPAEENSEPGVDAPEDDA